MLYTCDICGNQVDEPNAVFGSDYECEACRNFWEIQDVPPSGSDPSLSIDDVKGELFKCIRHSRSDADCGDILKAYVEHCCRA